MAEPAAAILVLNCGSSSIKAALFDVATVAASRAAFWRCTVDAVTSSPVLTEHGADPEPLAVDARAPYRAALEALRTRAAARLGARRLAGVAHRVVHGGGKYRAPVRVDGTVLADLKSYVPLAPLHQPFALEAIEAWLALEPTLPQVACFDTAFHHTMPQVERMLALPYAVWERGVRRYGFHGLSYEYLSIALPGRLGALARGRCIAAHLGNGASLCAMRDGASVATTMGFSALDGLVMATRGGALDPGALLYLMETEGMTPSRLRELLYHESGLLGVSGVSGDPRVLLPLEAADERVRAALALYVHRIVREIGALTAVLGGLDLLVFTAGVGEHNATIRARVCRELGFLGAELDEAANERHAPVISKPGTALTLAVEPTNEEWIAARQASALLA